MRRLIPALVVALVLGVAGVWAQTQFPAANVFFDDTETLQAKFDGGDLGGGSGTPGGTVGQVQANDGASGFSGIAEGSSGQVLTSNGAAAEPTFQAVGNATTATALAADPANCSAGQAAGGIAASGAGEACFTPVAAVLDEGVPVATQPSLNFIGAGVACVDGAGQTDCTISGGGFTPNTDPGVDHSGFATAVAADATVAANTAHAAAEPAAAIATHAGNASAHHAATVETNSLETVTTGIVQHEVPVGSGADVAVYRPLPATGTNGCAGAGEALQYNQTTQAWACEPIGWDLNGTIAHPVSAAADVAIGGTDSTAAVFIDESAGVINLNIADGGIQGVPPSVNGGVLSIYESTQEGGAGTEKQWRVSVDNTAGLAAEIDCGLNAQGQLPGACVTNAPGIAGGLAGNGRTYAECASIAAFYWNGTTETYLFTALERSDVDPPSPRLQTFQTTFAATATHSINFYPYHCTGETDSSKYPTVVGGGYSNIRVFPNMLQFELSCVTCSPANFVRGGAYTRATTGGVPDSPYYDGTKYLRHAFDNVVDVGYFGSDNSVTTGTTGTITFNTTGTYLIRIVGDIYLEP